jgi:hypothetical protein
VKLTELGPRWLTKDGKRVGFTFVSPSDPKWRQSCFAVRMPTREQWDLFGDDDVQGCRPDFAWTIAGGIETANFETMTVTPSLDGQSGRPLARLHNERRD